MIQISAPTSSTATMDAIVDAGRGIVRLAPTWVPRSFCTPGRRMKLHPDDLFPFAPSRGGIDERWLASTVTADNGPLTADHEGISMVVGADGQTVAFDELVEHLGGELLGSRIWGEHGGWPMYAKLFDNQNALPFHIHHDHEAAATVGKTGKPEAYFFPPQLNSHMGDVGHTYFGLHPGVTREQVADRLAGFERGGDNRITDLSVAHRIRLGTGWDVPGGILHAPASVCTYEPQAASDVFAMCESWSNDREVPAELLWKDIPTERHGDLDAVLELIDWEGNTDPSFWANRFMEPKETAASTAGAPDWMERWIVYRSPGFSAKELTVEPGATLVAADQDAHGLIVVQGRGQIGGHDVESPSLIRYGQMTADELFVSAAAASAGVTVANTSAVEPLVVLKHFGPGNAELASEEILHG